MRVIAAEGVQVPMEGQPRRYVTDGEAVDVTDSAYYRRRLDDGDLLLAPEGGPTPVEQE